MKVLLTNPETVDQVLAKLDHIWPLGEYNDVFIKYCVPAIKERLANGEVLYLDAEIGNTNYGLSGSSRKPGACNFSESVKFVA